MTGTALAIDFGTSNTVGATRRPDGRTEQVLFDGSPVLASAVFAQHDGTLLVGRDAWHAARLAPERFEPHPKLRVDDGTVLLGAELAVPDLFAAVLQRVATEARRSAGEIGSVALTHPAGWGTRRRQVLVRAAELAGLPTPVLLPEPVAAARLHRTGGTEALPLIVYDLGGGTLDVSVLDQGRVLATEGLPDTGGLDIDAALLAYLAATYRERDAVAWQRLDQPASAEDRRYRRQLLDDLRTAKELLSRSTQTFVHLPLLELDAPLGREQLEAIARPLVDRTVRATRAALAAAGLDVPPRAELRLIGGASRMPLVASSLHRALRIPPTVTEQPELAVAHGALATLASTVTAAPGARSPAAAGTDRRGTAGTGRPAAASTGRPGVAGRTGPARTPGGNSGAPRTVRPTPPTPADPQRKPRPTAPSPPADPGRPAPGATVSWTPLWGGMVFAVLGVTLIVIGMVVASGRPQPLSQSSVGGISTIASITMSLGALGILQVLPRYRLHLPVAPALLIGGGWLVVATVLLEAINLG